MGEDPTHARPFVHEAAHRRALYFSISAIQSRMDLRDPFALELEYTRTMMAFLLLQPDPRAIAMIGLGGGSLVKFCHRHLPAAQLQVVEINPHVIALRETFHVPPDDARLSVIQGDGAAFVRRHARRCDVLMVDGFDADGQPEQLGSRRFYDDAHALLQPGGVLVANLHPGHAGYEARIASIRRSFEESVLVVPDRDCSNTIVFAVKGAALERPAPGAAHRPKGLAAAGAAPLREAFARVRAAWTARRGD